MRAGRALSILAVAFILMSHSPFAIADSFTFETIPADGNVSGPAGSTVGWGYSITNQSLTDWLVTSGISAGTFFDGTPSAIFDFPILAPGATSSVPFDAIDGLGLYALIWNATAPVGFVNSGTFDLSVEWWDGDPFAGGSFASAADGTAPYTATVTPTPVPEPSTLLLMVLGLATMWLRQANGKPV